MLISKFNKKKVQGHRRECDDGNTGRGRSKEHVDSP
jgi:hypothetical protein